MSVTANSPGPNLNKHLLSSYEGKEITAICPHGYTDGSFNHCAHLVCHVMSLAIGYTCKHQAAKPAAGKAGACIRVHELFKSCPEVGVFSKSAVANKGLFVFVTAPVAVSLTAKTMANVPKKHVGIYFDGLVWHYSNTKDKVITATTEQFQKHYSSQTNALYYGTFPAGAVAVPLI